MGANGSDEGKPRSSGGLEDTVPASEPPLDIHGQPMRSSRSSIPPVTHERYRHGPELGRGGMGRVVEAFDTQLGRTVALKEVLPRGAGVARRFIREVEITARLEHASIVPLYDSGTTPDGRPFYVMRRVSGRPLDQAVTRARDLGERLTLLPAVLAAIDAVAHAHKRGIIHRDIKPANILVGELGETVVIDWGLAKVIGEEDEEGLSTNPPPADSLQTQIGSVFGTPGFMSPEQARGEPLSTRSDVYALGATLYHLLAGTPPHAGDSATIVLGRTLKHDVIPLEEAAPGAPPDLVAIVDKALAFEAEERYANASALGEDVRRFLTGQLVAAHRYTPRQRLGRFAKRHRTSLAIAALATVAVAALAWFSVHRIIAERDDATQARHAALAEKRAAEAAAVALADRNDAMLLTQARSLLVSNPTEAIALIKQLRLDSVRMPEARAIAQAAVTRGVWWAMQSTDVLTTFVELSIDGRQLLQVSRDNIVRVWDLERRRLVIARPYARNIFARWIAGAQLLVFGDDMVPEVLEPGANLTVPLGIEPIDDVEVSETGDRLLLTDRTHALSWFDLATRTRTPLWPGHAVHRIAIAPDGTWGVAADDKGAAAFDRDGKELLRVDGQIQRFATSRFRTFAMISPTKAVECKLDPTPVCTDLVYPVIPRPLILDMAYREQELMMYAASADVFGWIGGTMAIRARIDLFMPRLSEVIGGAMIVPTHTGKLHLLGLYLNVEFTLPVPLSHPRIATRPLQSRVVVVGDGQILVTDLSQMLPKILPETAAADAVFLDDDTLLAWQSAEFKWQRINVITGTRDSVTMREAGIPAVRDYRRNRALLVAERGTLSSLALLGPGSELVELARGSNLWGLLLDGNATLFGFAESRPDGSIKPDGRVFAKIGTGEKREIVKLDGEMTGAVARGALRYAVLSDRGELVRGNLADDTIERTRIDLGKRYALGGEPGGRVLIGNDNRLLVWDQQIHEVMRFDRPIAGIAPAVGGRVLVTLENHDVMEVSLVPGAPPSRIVAGGQYAAAVSRDGKLVAAPGNDRQIALVEIGATTKAARWTLPLTYRPTHMFAVSPTSRRIAQGTNTGVMVWNLPSVSADFIAWLDEQTNATKAGDEVLAWPWQVRKP